MSLVERALRKMQATRRAEPQTVDLEPALAPAADDAAAPPLRKALEMEAPSRVITLNHGVLRAAHMLPPEKEERLLAQEYRQIKRPLLANAFGRGANVPLDQGRVFMVASALPGDGKTFTSVNLAFSLVLEKDVNVLLVDADVAKPRISKVFGMEREAGLLDVLSDEQRSVESVIYRTDVPGISLLPAGRPSATATELLGSTRMDEIVRQLCAADAQRIVLFDSPPLLLTTESRALAGVVGQVVLVVRAGITPQSAVFEALELLGDGKFVGLVLNQSDERTHTGYYYSYGDTVAPEQEA